MENEVKVKVFSLAREGVYDLWTDIVLRIDSSKAAEAVEVRRKDADCVRGIRHRLQVIYTSKSHIVKWLNPLLHTYTFFLPFVSGL